MNPISFNVPGIPSIPSAVVPGVGKQQGGFQAALEGAISQVNELRQVSHQSIGKFLSGETEEVHQAVLATQQAELAFEMFLQVRNKVVQAYQEVMRMQV
ncbi:MAG: flagellar hook-basal body complex protein FliE [Bryobacteraceae bacterium]|nr:flagellar hook-basal body complex protein FliE [Bryobacterales bacterium]MEB2360649.1 flagellar hook-basal body complex protein FliE [Bryobacterales bacterium]NUN00228.1 flagellar hook-basal body complex protein FliE [Bryobacteraceae bacterium]